jgi:hypothetical protein
VCQLRQLWRCLAVSTAEIYVPRAAIPSPKPVVHRVQTGQSHDAVPVGRTSRRTCAAAAARVAKKEIRIADLATGLQRRQTPQTAMAAASAGSPESADPGTFLARLDAADKAIRSGLGLTTTEAAWILGVKPGAGVVTRGGIRATRTGWNCWRLESADSPDDEP